jgi:hypothetical protein
MALEYSRMRSVGGCRTTTTTAAGASPCNVQQDYKLEPAARFVD